MQRQELRALDVARRGKRENSCAGIRNLFGKVLYQLDIVCIAYAQAKKMLNLCNFLYNMKQNRGSYKILEESH